ncbi:hypothetical protein OQJ26_07575 [Legionella sp. PATHC038]|uniref:hypothetical protein n=1 Tax=Legionella sheltonii TaxID=2992041 RepID=UPI0022435BAA|nr:hypothetical protein [Legionella sp. PATHC038]MCW8398648.1 hypothetical protein [Legionella sp. PATHC038]
MLSRDVAKLVFRERPPVVNSCLPQRLSIKGLLVSCYQSFIYLYRWFHPFTTEWALHFHGFPLFRSGYHWEIA